MIEAFSNDGIMSKAAGVLQNLSGGTVTAHRPLTRRLPSPASDRCCLTRAALMTRRCVKEPFLISPTIQPRSGVHPMKAFRTLCRVTAITAVLGFALAANGGSLQYNGDYQGGRLIYDPGSGLTWYQAPYANVSWYDAMAWAAGLNIGGVSGWRLPSISPATVIDGGMQMVIVGAPDDGEMGKLWYDTLGNTNGVLTHSWPFDTSTWTWPYNTAYWTSSGPWYGHASTFAVFFGLDSGTEALNVIHYPGGAFGAEIAVCSGNIGPNGPVASTGPASLSVWRTDTNTVAVSWSLPDTGWRLQYATNLAGGAGAWTEVSPPYQSSGTNLCYIELAPVGNKFYRLYKP